MRNAVVGIVVAGALALVATGASISGVAAWKVVLAGIGLALFVTAGRPGKRRST